MRASHVPVTAACYPDGWHMLLRDLQRERVWEDIAAWIAEPDGVLPSGGQNLAPCEALAAAR